MSRRRKAVKRQVMPDPKFNDKVVSKFTSCLMYDGKRSRAEKIVYGAFEFIEKPFDQTRLLNSDINKVRSNNSVLSERNKSTLYDGDS